MHLESDQAVSISFMFTFALHVSFSHLSTFLCQVIGRDERSKGVDDGNLRMTFDSLLEKAKGRERERQRDDARRLRKLEQNFCDMLSSANFIRSDTSWDDVREKFNDHPAFRVSQTLVLMIVLIITSELVRSSCWSFR